MTPDEFGRPVASMMLGEPRAILIEGIVPKGERLGGSGLFAVLCPEHDGVLGDDLDETAARLLAYEHNAAHHEGAEAILVTPAAMREHMAAEVRSHRRSRRWQILVIVAPIVFLSALQAAVSTAGAFVFSLNASIAAMGGFTLRGIADRHAQAKHDLARFDAGFDIGHQ